MQKTMPQCYEIETVHIALALRRAKRREIRTEAAVSDAPEAKFWAYRRLLRRIFYSVQPPA